MRLGWKGDRSGVRRLQLGGGRRGEVGVQQQQQQQRPRGFFALFLTREAGWDVERTEDRMKGFVALCRGFDVVEVD